MQAKIQELQAKLEAKEHEIGSFQDLSSVYDLKCA